MKLGIILEGPDCSGKSTIALAIAEAARLCGTQVEIRHSTMDIATNYDGIPTTKETIDKGIQAVVHRIHTYKSAQPINLINQFTFIVFDRVDDISGPIYDNPRNEVYDTHALDNSIEILADRFGGRMSAAVIEHLDMFNKWKARQEHEYLKCDENYRRVVRRYYAIQQTCFIKHIYNNDPMATALQLLSLSVARAFSYA